jgi:uncharacterized cysteine cluster protein YcgN (CxxCxxCC family)
MELNGITYKQSKTYPDIYVSACGKILNVKPIGRVDKRDGYVVVREKRLHQLVVECWGEPRPKGKDWCIDHIDENKTNNKVENLRWLPRSENTRRSQIGKSNPRKAVVQMESEVKKEIVNLSNQGLSQRQIADFMGKSQRSIWNVLNGVY